MNGVGYLFLADISGDWYVGFGDINSFVALLSLRPLRAEQVSVRPVIVQ